MFPSTSYESQQLAHGVQAPIQASFNQAGMSFNQGQLGYTYGDRPVAQDYGMSNHTYYRGQHPSETPQCQEGDCVEEECNPDECGDEERGPDAGKSFCPCETRPLLPITLAVSTFVGGVALCAIQLPEINMIIGGDPSTSTFSAFVLGMLIAMFMFLYLITLGCMLYCAVSDPGQLEPRKDQAYTAMAELHRQGSTRHAEMPLPRRARKTWQFRHPVRRYDHYCRWVCNCIALLNHREFVVMCVGLVLIGVLGIAVDLVALIAAFSFDNWFVRIAIALHLFYSIVLLAFVGPILKIHVMLVSRNELASEWKKNEYWVVKRSKKGHNIPVNELSDDEFNENFDTFQYDHTRNPWDKGILTNCYSFWCIPRWPQDQLGEF